MNKLVKRGVCLLLSALTVFSFGACDEGEGGNSLPSNSTSDNAQTQIYDTETRPVVFAIEPLDGNFNPFYATSGGDSEIVSMTQIGMLTTDENGDITCGEDQPTVVLSYEAEEKTLGGKQYTDYSFVIKNGIKFSDGQPLTIKDVLFNIYMYLDPAYTGSATLYSTDIVGLKSYQSQEEDADDEGSGDTNARYEAAADARELRLMDYLTKNNVAETDEIKEDIAKIKRYFEQDINETWTASQSGLEDIQKEYTYTEYWQVFFRNTLIDSPILDSSNQPMMEILVEADGVTPKLDENGKKQYRYITGFTKAGAPYELADGQIKKYDGSGYKQELVDDITAATDKKAFALDYVYKTYIGDENFLNKAGIEDVLSIFPTTSYNFYTDLVAAERLKEKTTMAVSTISGITTDTTEIEGETYDVLKIRINDIDPKAIYNFAFAVTPMHYYSGTYKGVDYVKEARDDTTGTKFGVKWSDKDFYDTVVGAASKSQLPVGAGVYKATDVNGATTGVTGGGFRDNGLVYFARNEYFETVGEGLSNAKIKYLRYSEVNSDTLLQALEAKNIDVGEPNATADNITRIGQLSHLGQRTVATNGYGYVGVNPRFVPDIEVRQAIMKAMDLTKCIDYYTDANASLLYRSMSYESWIWDHLPKTNAQYADLYKPYYAQALNNAAGRAEIKALVESAGWTMQGGVYYKGGKALDLTFTIAGSTTDHPAYKMFTAAETLLEQCGFKITVTTDNTALKKLATGQLQVWAAAWSSTVDPDMYQVYHKDSNATSIKNWGYDYIAEDKTEQFTYETQIIADLAVKIEEGREKSNKLERASIYAEALDMVMQLAVELPTYQRNDCVAYNKLVIDEDTLNAEPTAFAGVIDRIWELNYN